MTTQSCYEKTTEKIRLSNEKITAIGQRYHCTFYRGSVRQTLTNGDKPTGKLQK